MSQPVPLRRPRATPEQGYASPNVSYWDLDPEQTPELRWPESIDVYDRMRRQDGQVISVLEAVMLPVQSTTWQLDPAGARDEVVQHVADDLGLGVKGADPSGAPPRRLRNRFSWSQHLEWALLKLVFGHMFFEQVYNPPGTDGLLHLRKLAPRWPRTIAKVNVATDGGLVSIEQYPPAGSSGPVVLDVSRLVAYVHKREGANWLGVSLLRPAYKNWLLKDRTLRTWTQALDRNGMGIPWYTAGDPEEDLTKGEALAKGLRAGDNSGGAGPTGSTMTLLGVQGKVMDPEKAVRYHDELIAKSVLAHFTNLGQSTGTGSYALGVSFIDFFLESLQNLAQSIADTATQHVVEDLVDLNWGPDEPAPRIVFEPIGQNPSAVVAAVQVLIGAGAIFPDPALDAFVRKLVGLPPKAPLPSRPAPAPTPGSSS